MSNLKVEYKRDQFNGHYYDRAFNRTDYTVKGYQVYVNGEKYAIILKDETLKEWFCYPDLKSEQICGGLTLSELKDTLENRVLPKDPKFTPEPIEAELKETKMKKRKEIVLISYRQGNRKFVYDIIETSNLKSTNAYKKINEIMDFDSSLSGIHYTYGRKSITETLKSTFFSSEKISLLNKFNLI